jgi:hypothetical protein
MNTTTNETDYLCCEMCEAHISGTYAGATKDEAHVGVVSGRWLCNVCADKERPPKKKRSFELTVVEALHELIDMQCGDDVVVVGKGDTTPNSMLRAYAPLSMAHSPAKERRLTYEGVGRNGLTTKRGTLSGMVADRRQFGSPGSRVEVAPDEEVVPRRHATTQSVGSYTNSLLTTARSCLRKYQWQYVERIELDADEEKEALAVGTCWHKAHEATSASGDSALSALLDPYLAIAKHAPNELWNEKLRRMYAAHGWYWSQHDDAYESVGAEHEFEIEHEGVTYKGAIDDVLRHKATGRIGVKEIKTTGDSLGDDSMYWRRWRLNTQVGLYALALGERPSFILLDVTKKPTIKPKRLIKKDVERMRAEFGDTISPAYADYCGEQFHESHIEDAIAVGQESNEMYGARLTQDIGERPEFYFARREITRTEGDYDELMHNLKSQVDLISYAEQNGLLHRNPGACEQYSCDFFSLCESNVRPQSGIVPTGFRRREKLHPELS